MIDQGDASVDDMRHEGPWNSFKFDPAPLHDDVLRVADLAESLGYRFLFRPAEYSLEEVQARLREEGPSAFLRIVRVQEDISPKAPLPTAEQFLVERLKKLDPQTELIITDPYFFTHSRRHDADEYAASVARIVTPLLGENVRLKLVIDPNASHDIVRGAVEGALCAKVSGLTIEVIESRDFHDRFWIADRERGVIIGTSLNKLGGKIYFSDALSDSDVVAVLDALES